MDAINRILSTGLSGSINNNHRVIPGLDPAPKNTLRLVNANNEEATALTTDVKSGQPIATPNHNVISDMIQYDGSYYFIVISDGIHKVQAPLWRAPVKNSSFDNGDGKYANIVDQIKDAIDQYLTLAYREEFFLNPQKNFNGSKEDAVALKTAIANKLYVTLNDVYDSANYDTKCFYVPYGYYYVGNQNIANANASAKASTSEANSQNSNFYLILALAGLATVAMVSFSSDDKKRKKK